MALSERKEKILQAVVDSYINSCDPISSAEIQKNHLPSLSSATIRNELAALEEMGYLAQPHTSAGRVPTAEAYRLYINRLMPKHKLSRNEIKTVKRYFNRKITEIDDILRSTAKVISEITNLTSVAYAENFDEATVECVKIIRLTPTTAVVLVATSMGVLKDATVQISSDMADSYLETAATFVTESFGGNKISEIIKPNTVIKKVKSEYEKLFDLVVKILKDYAKYGTVSDLVLEGSAKILQHPEYSNLTKAKAMLELLDSKEELVPLLGSAGGVSLDVKISGDDELKDGIPEHAIVTASYNVNGVSVGHAGVIGPMRMDYSKVISVLDYISKNINLLQNENDSDEDSDIE